MGKDLFRTTKRECDNCRKPKIYCTTAREIRFSKILGEAATLRELDLHRALDELINGQIKLNERHFQELKLDGFGAVRVAAAIRFVFNGCVHIYNEIRNPASLKLENQLMEPPTNNSYNFYFGDRCW